MLSLLPHPKSCGNRYRCLVTSLEVVDFIKLKFILIQGLTYLLSLIFCISNQKGNESMENQVKTLRARREKIETLLNNVAKQFVLGDITNETFLVVKNDFSETLSRLDEKIEMLLKK